MKLLYPIYEIIPTDVTLSDEKYQRVTDHSNGRAWFIIVIEENSTDEYCSYCLISTPSGNPKQDVGHWRSFNALTPEKLSFFKKAYKCNGTGMLIDEFKQKYPEIIQNMKKSLFAESYKELFNIK